MRHPPARCRVSSSRRSPTRDAPTSTTTTRCRPHTSGNCPPEGGITSLLGFAARLRQLGLDLLRDLGELRQDIDRLLLVLSRRDPLQLRACLLEAVEQLLRPLEG